MTSSSDQVSKKFNDGMFKRFLIFIITFSDKFPGKTSNSSLNNVSNINQRFQTYFDRKIVFSLLSKELLAKISTLFSITLGISKMRYRLKKTKENVFSVYVSLIVLMALLFSISFFPFKNVFNKEYKYTFLMIVGTEKRFESYLWKRTHSKALNFQKAEVFSKNLTIKNEINLKNFTELIGQRNLTTKKLLDSTIGYFSSKKISSDKFSKLKFR